jgi:glycosyltransferase involved in cell wall biosynthesis
MTLKICVYAISKNEEAFVDRFCESAKDADLILIADTGSTDKTVGKARKRKNVQVHEICITPWRFDDARNAALALIPKDFDVCVSLDLDEELQPGWREEIERLWVDGTNRFRYKYDWGDGLAFFYDRIHARHGYRWRYPCHEYLFSYMIDEKCANTDKLLVVHKPDQTKSRGQYLPLLEMAVKEDPHNPHHAFYYARELSFHSMWQEAIEECNRYLSLPGANWAGERCYAYRAISKSHLAIGNWDSAMKAARMAMVEAPDTREPWVEISKLAYEKSLWAECYGAATTALSINHRAFIYTEDPSVWGAPAHDYASIAAWNLGLTDIAIEQCKLAIEHAPDDERLLANLKSMTEKPD